MKILYLKLVNSAGIYAGTNKREIEIDFTKGNNNIIMLFGGNGSGKSTIISSLHPFNSTCNDERDRFFIEGKEGEKEIHYLLDDTVYMIRHYVSAKNKTKSYLAKMDYEDYKSKTESKDEIADKYGEELNENGGVLTFKDLIEIHLGVDEEFFKISRIGSNVTNFIDLSTANRKKYISTFLPNIDEYLQRYKIVNEKYKIMTKEIKYLSDEILKLDDETTLKTEKNRLEKQLETLRKALEKCNDAIASSKTTVSMLDKDGLLKSNKYENPYIEELKKIEKEKNKIELYTEKYSLEEIKNIISETEAKLSETKELIVQTIDKIDNEKENLGTISIDIKTKRKQIEGMNAEDLSKLKALKDKTQEKIQILNNEIKNLDLSNFLVENLSDDISSQVYSMRHIYTVLNEEQSKISIEYKNVLEKIFITKIMKWNQFTIEIEKLKLTKSDKEKEKQDLQSQLAIANSNRKYLTILEQRPQGCKDDTCPFISNALKYKNIEKEIEDISIRIDTITNEIDILNEKIDIFENVKSIGTKIERLYKEEETNLLSLHKVIKDFNINNFESLMTYFLSSSNLDRKNILFDGSENLKYYNSLVKEISENEKELSLIDSKIKANESIDNIYNELTKELETLKDKQTEILFDIEEKNKLLSKYENTKEQLESTLTENYTISEIFDEKQEVLSKYNETKNNFDNSQNILTEISNLADIIASKKEEKESYNDQIPLVENSLDKVKLKINKLKEYIDRKKKLEDNYEKTSWIKDALNPTKGIPVFFINDYLDKTKFITNNLLDISQNGKFAIDFDVTEKDFFIKVYKNNGDILSDISQASQGESALTSLSLSLALMEQSMKKYNIFLLDELDGALDSTNRRCFIDMVQSQMKILNTEQVFIISHNNEFENLPVDMILLKDNNIDTGNKEFMSNKTVLFKV